MAKKRSGKKSQAVRDYLKEHPQAANKEVAEALTAQGIKVTGNLVANIKARVAKRREVVKTVVSQRGLGIPEIKAGLALLKVCGSVSAAKEALAAAEEIKKAV
ncbi:MAG: hypothetical protein ACLQNE_26685 [Thermoguttaceae bacterium]|jgi:hypothetical protein